jgi:hypothetical protein
MLKQLCIFLLAGLLILCGLGSTVLGLFATNQLTPPQTTLQMGALTVRAIPACKLDDMTRGPCFLADSAAHWLIQLAIDGSTGWRQEWILYGGGNPPLYVDHR